MNDLSQLLCKISENSPHWARVLLTLNPQPGDANRLTANGITIHLSKLLYRYNQKVEAIFVPVVHAILEHPQDRQTLAREGADETTLRAFDVIADALASLAASRGARGSMQPSSVARELGLPKVADSAKTVRALAGVALAKVRALDKDVLFEIASGAGVPALTETFVTSAPEHDPAVVRSRRIFSTEMADIPFDGLEAEAGALFEPYAAMVAAKDDDAVFEAIVSLTDIACDYLENPTKISNAPAWATLLMEISLGKILSKADYTSRFVASDAHDRYFELRRKTGIGC